MTSTLDEQSALQPIAQPAKQALPTPQAPYCSAVTQPAEQTQLTPAGVPRHVGHFTLGVTLMVFGIVLLLILLVPSFQFTMLLKFSPIFLILLGLEILHDCARHPNDENSRLDFGSITIGLVLVSGAVVLALAANAVQAHIVL